MLIELLKSYTVPSTGVEYATHAILSTGKDLTEAEAQERLKSRLAKPANSNPMDAMGARTSDVKAEEVRRKAGGFRSQ